MSSVVVKNMLVSQLESYGRVIAAQYNLDESEVLGLAATMVSEVKVKAEKKVVERKEVDEEKRCMARVWGPGAGKQCTRAHGEGVEYCSLHNKQALETECACSFNDAGEKFGLFCGRIDSELPIFDSNGDVVIIWNDESAKKAVAEALAGGKTYNKNTAEGKKALGIKPTPKVKVVVEGVEAEVKAKVVKAKVVGEKVVKAKKAKDPNAPKRPLNAYMKYAQVVRPALAKEMKEADPKCKVTDIAKAIGVMWKALSDEERAEYGGKPAVVEAVDELTTEEETLLEEIKALPAAAEEEVDATPIEIEGVEYYKTADENVYDGEGELVGKYVDGKLVR